MTLSVRTRQEQCSSQQRLSAIPYNFQKYEVKTHALLTRFPSQPTHGLSLDHKERLYINGAIVHNPPDTITVITVISKHIGDAQVYEQQEVQIRAHYEFGYLQSLPTYVNLYTNKEQSSPPLFWIPKLNKLGGWLSNQQYSYTIVPTPENFSPEELLFDEDPYMRELAKTIVLSRIT